MNIERTDVYEKLNRIFQKPKEDIQKEFSPYFYDYFKNNIFENSKIDNNEPFRGYVETQSNLFYLADAKNKSVLDTGCGFGLISIMMYVLGAKEVVGVDINEEKIQCFEKLIKKLNLDSEVTAKLQDAHGLSFEENKFDVAISNEVISHVRDPGKYLDELYRVIKNKGKLVIRDNNNALNKKIVRGRKQSWLKSEYGPVEGTGLKKSYMQIRSEMIETNFPKLNKNQIEMLSRKTQGLWGKEIMEEINHFLKTGKINNHSIFPYRNPETGELPDIVFNPYDLADDLRTAGFKVIELRPLLPIAKERILLRRFLRPLNRFLFQFLSEGFEITAVKDDDGKK
jgi:2-polyprenyl-3-methyl-5-hydroxy-6-metoxy-1,4-benzoquinol methylase